MAMTVIMLRLSLVAFVPLLLAGCDSAVKHDPTPADFIGTWIGKWDDKWPVRFSISQDPKAGKLDAVYEWGEHLDEHILEETHPATIEGDALHVGKRIQIVISADDENRASAVGYFRQTRRADLQRQPKAMSDKIAHPARD
jgi:hypothetical protein